MKPLLALGLGLLLADPGVAQAPATIDYAAKVTEGDVKLRDFRFRSGERLDELNLHYRALGTPRRDSQGRITNAVMILHGTGGSGAQFLQPQFAQELYGAGQPLDLALYYIILPDALGHGKSSKPSDGLHMHFPKYDYDDMVEAQRRLLVDGLKVARLRLLMGTSMGCMHGFVWGTTHAEMIQAMMPLACLPKTIAGHNRMWRKAAMDGIRADPAWQNGDYAQEPAQGLRTAVSLLQVMGFATLYEQTTNPTRESADAAIEARIERALVGIDANDMIYQLDASRHYDPSDALEKVTMPVSWINSADDLINPWNYGIAEDFAKRMPRAHYVLIPASSETRGHATHTWAKFWKQELVDLLARSGAGD